MKYIDVDIEMTVRVPQYTAKEWELYSSSVDCSEAATALNLCLHDAIYHRLRENLSTELAYSEYCRPTMLKFSSFGAMDTEPRGIMWEALDRFKVVY